MFTFINKLFKKEKLDTDKFVNVIANFKFIDADAKDGFVEILKGPEGLVKTRAFNGCLNISCFNDLDNSNNLIIYQKWKSKEDHQSYLNWRKESGMIDQLAPTLTEPLVPIYLNSLPSL